jgi:3-polyprenyl-4-hydroxybenzoate decarboxylase
MPRPKKEIPFEDIKGLKTLLNEGKTQAEIGEIFGVDQKTISRRIQEFRNKEPPKIRLIGCLEPKKKACNWCIYRDASSDRDNNVCGIFDKHEIIRVFNES